MINVTELRIGNKLLYNNEVITVTMFSPNTVYYGENKQQSTKAVQPIKLNREWMERCGGSKNIGTPFYCIEMPSNIGEIHINPSNGMIWLRHHRNDNTLLNPYSGNAGYYLHSLQNLFFALTGSELTVNLPAKVS